MRRTLRKLMGVDGQYRSFIYIHIMIKIVVYFLFTLNAQHCNTFTQHWMSVEISGERIHKLSRICHERIYYAPIMPLVISR